MRFAIPAGAVALLLSAAAVPTFAASIGLNFSSGSTGALASGTSAGASTYAQADWNNLSGGSGTASSGLVDSNGGSLTASAPSVSWTSSFDYSPQQNGRHTGFTVGSGDDTLMTNFLAKGASVTVTGIPYTSYTVVAYLIGDQGGYNSATGVYLANAGGGTGGLDTDQYFMRDDEGGTYDLATQTTVPADTGTNNANGYQYANYAVFTGNTFSGFTLSEIDRFGGYADMGFTALQIIDTTPAGSPVPEPASLGLLAVGAVGLLRRKGK